MKLYLISDNIDTQMGMRLAGVEGVVVHERDEVLAALNKAIEDPEIAIVLMTTKIVNTCPDVVSDYKLRLSKPLLVEIPDRHGSAKIGETIDRYISCLLYTSFDQDTGFELKEYRMINGIQQYLVHRTENDENPVLLVLHGGPGESAMPTRYLYQREWEKYFTVVNWDQRLCGKTLKINADQKEELASSLTLDQLIEDTREICDVLRAQYHQDKIFILGHSWGSVLGTLFVRKYPDRVKAYVLSLIHI